MTEENKELKIQFAPGCFDDFEGSQEELDLLVKEIQEMFASKSREEIEAMSHQLTDEEFDELTDDAKNKIYNSFEGLDSEKRNLQ
jgi:HPt (histidine-containing phosphotransfer) domain-containing protein